ncbi:MAG: SIMPL domain-containing protein [Candidatus Atribacteria bacterium]|nr:SIMPL domain-containing protein [Candidatus Atribacteria bacterium]
MSKKNTFFTFFFLLFVVITVIFGYPVNITTAYAADERQKIIQTYGEAELTAPPDLAKISLSIETRSSSANKAVEENARLANRVLQALLNYGLREDNIKTSSYRLYSYREGQKTDSETEQEQIYYQATNEMLISTTQLDTVGEIIDLAVKAGANNINYINFELSDPQELMFQALTMATKQAGRKAEAIAEGVGVTIQQLYSIREERTFYTPSRSENTMLTREMAASAPTPISPEAVIVRASVIAEFSF